MRPGIAFIVNYAPSETTSNNTILDTFQKIGLTNTPFEQPQVKLIENRTAQDSASETVVSQCCTVLKDHNSNFVHDLIKKTVQHCATKFPDVQICTTGANLVVVNPAMLNLLNSTYEQLLKSGVELSIKQITTRQDPHKTYFSSEPKGVDKSMAILLHHLVEQGLAIRQGFVYAKVLGSTCTYFSAFTVETFVHKCLSNPMIRGKISLSHVTTLVARMGHVDFSMIPQLEINQDLIEVSDGKVWDLSKLAFVDNPITPDMIGRVSPRAFLAHNPTTVPNPTHFIDTINNSFPERPEQTLFLLKWYQLLFAHRHQMKIACLLVHGVRDCGKTSIAGPILELIPPECVASITCEKNQFSTSMLKPTTMLTFVDEFTGDHLDAATAKNVLQGGFMVTADKHKSGRAFENHSMFYFTAQQEPNWGLEDENVKRRLMIFKMKALPTTHGNVAQWLREHAVECIIWAGITIRRGLDSLPLSPAQREDELFFMNDVTLQRNAALIRRLSHQLSEVVTDNNSDVNYELFNDADEGESDASQVRGHSHDT